MERIHLVIKGRVQGVFYRKSATAQAIQLGLTGWVRNRNDGTVELVAEGGRAELQQLVDWCWTGPRLSRVTDIEVCWLTATQILDGFVVRPTE